MEGRGGRGRSGDLFLGEIVSIFPKNIYIYIIDSKYDTPRLGHVSRERGAGRGLKLFKTDISKYLYR